ncbi:unnamed protein product [Mytilus edulis]|uniref:Fibronectin type-III domain-containing protein n=1 Tax=Mytilus edulis TaxID=6550 RepID=A0A8S3U7G7_MYTED|nr:unnamed protein product [Mytilus edulis]
MRSQSESTERCHGRCKQVESHDKICQNKPLYDGIIKVLHRRRRNIKECSHRDPEQREECQYCDCSIRQYCRDSYCYQQNSVDINCNDNNECLSPMTCIGGTCQCAVNKYWTGSTCSAEKSVSVSCGADNECLRPMTCTGGTCECVINHRWTGLTCAALPQKPFAVAAIVESSSEIQLTWNLLEPKPGITTYYIKVYEVVLNVQLAFVKGENVTGFDKRIVQFSGLEAYWNYTFTVVATTDKGSSEQSDMSSVITTYQDAPGRVTSFEIKRPSVILTTMEVSWSVPLLRERNGIIKEYKIDHNISGTTTTETIAAEYEKFQKLYYITPDRYYQIEIYAVNSINQAGVKLLKIYYASSKIEASPQVSPKGYTIATVVGAAGGCVIIESNNTQEESKIGGQYEEVGINNVSANIELGTIDDKNVYDQIDRIPTTDKQYENMMCK